MDSLKIVDKAILELIEEYKKRKNYFFSEREIHAIFYCKLSSLGDLVHPEYITRKRFKRIRGKKTNERYTEGIHCFEPSDKLGKRGHYDFGVLNKEFYTKYKYDIKRLSNEEAGTNLDLKIPYLDIAIEFKYITGTFDEREVEYDLFKLKQASEVENKKLIIFTKKRPTDKNYDTMIQSLEKMSDEESEIDIKVIKDG